jgi:flagellar motor protein MotB
MRVLIITLAVFFSTAALLITTMAFLLPARKAASTAGRTLEGEAKISAALQESPARTSRQQTAGETTLSELWREIYGLNDELDAPVPVPAAPPRKNSVPEEDRPRREPGATTPEGPPAQRYPVVTGAEEEGRLIAILGGGLFPSGEKTPPEELLQAILRILPAIVVSPESLIVVEGHADSTPTRAGGGGSFADNKALSLQRAEVIARLLEEEGIDPARIAVAGYGDTRPLAPNTTEDGRAENRRVEIRLVPHNTASQQR